MNLRDYQKDILDQVVSSNTNDIIQLDTGAGKTPIEAMLSKQAEYSLIVAHRNILITQISDKLAACRVEHDTISTGYTRSICAGFNSKNHGNSFIKRFHSSRRVASIDSLVSHFKRGFLEIDRLKRWLIIIDEAHHVVPNNKWGRLKEIFPNARIIGFTATPARMDGQSLHVENGGIFHRLIQSNKLSSDSTRELISKGYLSDFEVYSAKRIKYRNSNYYKPTINGLDYYTKNVCLESDPVKEYIARLNGERAIMMSPSIKNAEVFAKNFRDNGIPAACISSNLSRTNISRILNAFDNGRILVLTNVDMVGEGFDLPSVSGLIIATRTASFVRYKQWVGRILRPADCKSRGIIIDLTGMVADHGMPDDPIDWDLLNPPFGPNSIRHAPCHGCGFYYPFINEFCQKCGKKNLLLERKESEGGFYFNVEMLDKDLLLSARNRISNEKKQHLRKTEIIKKDFVDGEDIVGKTIKKLRVWFISEVLNAGAGFAEVNDFLDSREAKLKSFWMKYFTAKDIKNGSQDKAKKVFKEWKINQK